MKGAPLLAYAYAHIKSVDPTAHKTLQKIHSKNYALAQHSILHGIEYLQEGRVSIQPQLVSQLQLVFEVRTIHKGTAILGVPAHGQHLLGSDDGVAQERLLDVARLHQQFAHHVLQAVEVKKEREILRK